MTNNAPEISCNSYVYERSVFSSTMQIDLTSSCYMAGMAAGSLLAGYVADKYGRFKPIVFGASLAPVFGIAAALMPNIGLYCFFRFLLSSSIFTAFITSTVYIPEIIGAKYRPVAAIFFHILFSSGGLFLILLSYNIRDFFYLQLVMSIPLLLIFPVAWILIESPRWQLIHGDLAEVMKALKKIADINNKSLPDDVTIKTVSLQSAGKITLWDLLQSSRLRLNLFIAYLIWFTVSLVYYGLSLNAGNLSGDVFLNFFLITFTDIPAHLLATWTSYRFGRRITLICAFLTGGTACFLSIPLLITSKLNWMLVTFSMIGKAGAAIGFSVGYLITAEMIPTHARQVSMGTSSICSRVSGIISPYVGGPLNSVWIGMSSVIFGSFAIACGLSTFALPETLGKRMPDTIEEAEQMKKQNSNDQVLLINQDHQEQHEISHTGKAV